MLLFLLPIFPFLMSLTPNTKLVNLGIWVILVVLVLGFVVIIEYVHEALHRELDLADLSDEDLQTMMQMQTHQSGHSTPLFAPHHHPEHADEGKEAQK